MLTNSDATIYSRNRADSGDTWTRVYVPKVWWYENSGSTITTNGMKSNASVLTVRIPDISVQVKKGDYIVKGECGIMMESVKDLEGCAGYCVTGANYNRFGANPHIKVVAT